MQIEHCTLCPNRCGVDRRQQTGKCHAPAEALICRAALHMWEEPIISGMRGSGTIFFAGCSLACVFCQNYEISHRAVGKRTSVQELTDIMRRLVDEGAHNINFVNPTHYAHILKEALTAYRPPVPIVYNSGGYDTADTLKELCGLVDVYLPDLKYLSPELALRYTGKSDYPTVAKAAIDEMVAQLGEPILRDGLLQRGVIVRHLVLPSHADEGVRVMQYLTERYGDRIYISAMSQYTPHGRAAEFPEINRRLHPIEYKRAVAVLRRAGQKNCFTQDFESASEMYIPDFDI